MRILVLVFLNIRLSITCKRIKVIAFSAVENQIKIKHNKKTKNQFLSKTTPLEEEEEALLFRPILKGKETPVLKYK